ncbi:MAG TPA: Gfo/Idh/MocA family oxidoreductase [Bacteroidales bacterium]|nr:Gfo/Idh/MocA family oxidoreductase [Bacteroidales bacterium]
MTNRRDFLKLTALTGLSFYLSPAFAMAQEVKKTTVRIGLIGAGLRGCNHLELLLARNDVVVPAICDIDPERIEVAKTMIRKAGKKEPEVYTGSEWAWEKLLQRTDIDGVVIATPWLWHTKMTVGAMKAGKYAGVEVSAATTLDECWDLVNAHEETRVPMMILENVCYRRDIMAVLNMVRQNVFGELLYAHCGYQHDLREVKFEPGVEFGDKGVHEAHWRTWHSVYQNGDIYPTHGLGPVAVMMNINRGNRFLSLTSSATKTRGLHKYIVDKAGPDHPNAKVRFRLGDIVTSTITTVNGENIVVIHDTNNPRPYSLGFRIQGTQGLWMDDGDQVYVEGISSPHRWDKADEWLKKYDHPLWKKYEHLAEGAGHGGMDFFVINAFVEIIRRQAPAPLDAYDAAAWSAVTPLSEASIAAGGAPQEFPDFTNGQWMVRKPVFALDDTY